MKRCSYCHLEKSPSEFGVNKKAPDGLQYRCKSCFQKLYQSRRELFKKEARDRYRADPGRFAERDKKYKQTHPEQVSESAARSRTKYRNHRQARGAVAYAVKMGRLIRLPCDICGDKNSEAHHPSYEKKHWLDVTWLCKPHHTKIHRIPD